MGVIGGRERVDKSNFRTKRVVVNNILNNPGIFGKIEFRPESPDNPSKLAKKQPLVLFEDIVSSTLVRSKKGDNTGKTRQKSSRL